MEVDIKRRDIWLGRRGDPEWCALARALRRQTGRPWRVAPGTATDIRHGVVHRLTPEADQWFQRFDRKAPVHPGRLTVWLAD